MYGKEIKETRKNYNVTQTQLSKATGLPQNTISWIESDKGIPNVHQCKLIADFYGISIEELIGQEDKPKYNVNQTIHDNQGNINNNFK